MNHWRPAWELLNEEQLGLMHPKKGFWHGGRIDENMRFESYMNDSFEFIDTITPDSVEALEKAYDNLKKQGKTEAALWCLYMVYAVKCVDLALDKMRDSDEK